MCLARGGAVLRAVGCWLVLAWPAAAVEVAVLPPGGLAPWSNDFKAAAEDAGLALRVLTPEQVVDGAEFAPGKYPVALLLNGTEYVDTVAEQGDATEALSSYVQQGGSLLILSDGPALSQPLCKVGDGWTVAATPLRRINLQANLGLLDAGQPWRGALPAGAALTINAPPALAGRLPAELSIPATGDQVRFLPAQQLDHLEVHALAELVIGDGRTYGAPLAMVLNRRNEAAGPVAYGWSPLVAPKLAAELLAGLAGYRAEVARLTAEEDARFAGDAVKDGDGAWLDDPQPVVALQFNKGVVYVELWPDIAPKHVESFSKLIGEQFYDGIFVHRVEPGFVIQAGDPITKQVGGPSGPGVGTGGPGYTVPAEFSDKPHVKGTLSMARSSEPDSGGSQFFICLDRATHLDGNYSVFGQVLGDGMSIVDRLKVGDRIVHGWVVKPATP